MKAPAPAPKPLFPNLVAAALSAVLALAYAGGFGALVFSGPLEPFVGRAVLAALVGSILVLPMLAWRSSFYFSLGGPDSNSTAILGFILASIASDAARALPASAEQLAPTALMFVCVSAIGCGLVLYALGALRWGRYVRFIPHPVAAGFMAGSGCLLVQAAWKMLAGRPFSPQALADLSQAHPLGWISMLCVAAALLVLTRLVRHFLVVPATLLASVLAFHAARAALGLSVTAARNAGLLLSPLQIADWTHAGNFPYALVRWDLLYRHAGDFAAMSMVAVIAILLTVTSLELATGVEGDADRELKTLGAANVLIGLGGGMVSLNSFNRTVISLEAGANSRRAAVCCAVMILGAAVFAPWLIGLLPRTVLAGLVLYLGLSYLVSHAYESRLQMPLADYAIVLAIAAVIGFFGIVPGVALGLVAACVSLVFQFSRSPSVRNEFSLRDRRSNVERPARQNELLREEGGALSGFALQGFLFFGTAAGVLGRVRAALPRTKLVLLDFRLVHGIDGSATMALRKLKALCGDGRVLVLTGLSAGVEEMLRRCGVELDDPALRTFPDLDRGLEWCEDFLLEEAAAGRQPAAPLQGWFDAAELKRLSAHFQRARFGAGETVFRQGDPGDSMLIIERGRVSVHMRVSGEDAPAARRLRLRAYTGGTVVGEMGFYSGAARTADVVADEETQALKLSADAVARLEREAPALAAKLQRFVAFSLVERLSVANAEIRALN